MVLRPEHLGMTRILNEGVFVAKSNVTEPLNLTVTNRSPVIAGIFKRAAHHYNLAIGDIMVNDPAADEAAFWQWIMPDSYDDGTVDITYYWEAGATSSDVIWCFQAAGVAANNTEDIDPALSTAVCETDTAQGNANDLASVTETGATSSFAAGEYVTFKVFRDADAGGDTMTGDARLVKVKIEYLVDQETD